MNRISSLRHQWAAVLSAGALKQCALEDPCTISQQSQAGGFAYRPGPRLQRISAVRAGLGHEPGRIQTVFAEVAAVRNVLQVIELRARSMAQLLPISTSSAILTPAQRIGKLNLLTHEDQTLRAGLFGLMAECRGCPEVALEKGK